jgi:hypothetical protein
MIQGFRDDITDEEIQKLLESRLDVVKLTVNRDHKELHGVQAIVDVIADPAVLSQLEERFDGMIVDGRPLRVRSMLY